MIGADDLPLGQRLWGEGTAMSHRACSRPCGTPLGPCLPRLTLNQGCSRVCSALGLLWIDTTG